jgi:hypothetical protein
MSDSKTRTIEKMKITIEIEGDKKSVLTLPVIPASIQEERGWNTTTVNLNSKGTVSLLGKADLIKLPISSYFPRHYQSGICAVGADSLKEPYAYVEKIKDMQGKICRAVVTGSNNMYNMLCTINNFQFGENDGSGDVQYTLDLVEYKKPDAAKVTKAYTTAGNKTASSKKSKPARSSKKAKKTYKTVTHDTLYKIAKKKHGTKKAKSYAKKIYNLNKKTLNSAYARYTKIILKRKNGKAAAKKYKKTAAINKQIPKNVTLKLPK